MVMMPLGTNGYAPSYGRQTMCFLLRWQKTVVFLDAGTGLGRLFEQTHYGLLVDCDRIVVILSHYHLDHVMGLSFLSGLIQTGISITLYCPSPPLVEVDAFIAISQLLSPPLFAQHFDQMGGSIQIVKLTGADIMIDGMRLRLRGQKHPGGSVGFRLGDQLAYLTDTAVEPSSGSFIRGVSLLMHEVWLSNEEKVSDHPDALKHSDTLSVSELAVSNGVTRLMPIHHNPARSNEKVARLWLELERPGLQIIRPEEGRIIDLTFL